MTIEAIMDEAAPVDQRYIAETWLTGHFRNAAFPETHNVSWTDVKAGKLKPGDEVVRQAFQSRSQADVNYVGLCRHLHGRDPDYDGDLRGGALAALLAMPRCGCPDHPLSGDDLHALRADELHPAWPRGEAVGPGNWPECHGVEDNHCCAVRWNLSGISSALRPLFGQVLANVTAAYRQVGLLFVHVDAATGRDLLSGKKWDGPFQVEGSFVQRSGGWIGLAIVASNQGCRSSIWCRYLATYRPRDLVREWTTLVKHELGHNTGSGHLRGFTMNPSIVSGLPTDVFDDRDPFKRWLRGRYGGEVVPKQPFEKDGEPEPPTPPDPGPSDWKTINTFTHDGERFRVQVQTADGGGGWKW